VRRHGSFISVVGGRAFRDRRERFADRKKFAVTLPLLLVLVVGIFDFGNAFNMSRS